MVTETAQTAEVAEQGGVLGTLGISPTLFTAQLINFTIVVLVMWRWVYRPLLAMIEKRNADIAQGIAHAKQAETHLAEAAREKEDLLQATRREAHELLEQTKAQAEVLRKEKITQARAEIEKIAVEAKEQLRAERDSAYAALKVDIARLVAQATQRVVAGMDEKTHRQIIEKAIRDIEEV